MQRCVLRIRTCSDTCGGLLFKIAISTS
jgi:hypothetical protein